MQSIALRKLLFQLPSILACVRGVSKKKSELTNKDQLALWRGIRAASTATLSHADPRLGAGGGVPFPGLRRSGRL